MALQPLAKGSTLRPNGDGSYRSIAAVGGAPVTVAAGNTGTMTFSIAEACWVDRLILDGAGLTVTDIKHNNDSLLTGTAPITMFAHDSVGSPRMGQYFKVSDVVTVAFSNATATAITVNGAFSAL